MSFGSERIFGCGKGHDVELPASDALSARRWADALREARWGFIFSEGGWLCPEHYEQAVRPAMSEREHERKWQPVMMVAEHRVDCGVCGALAVFVILDDEHDSQPDAVHTGESDWGYSAWCQDCWQRAQEDEPAEGGERR